MSFDSTFDYSGVVTGITNDLNTINTQLTTLTAQIALIQSAPTYIASVANQLATFTQQVTSLQNRATQINASLTEIANIQALPADSKTTLYYFYTVLNAVGISLQDFMSKMPFNLIALDDPTIQTLIADTTTPTNVRISIASALYSNYNVDNRFVCALRYLPR